jgi:D-alanyl-D-alanine carboxypeptidase
MAQLTFGQTFSPVLSSRLQTKLDSMKTAYNIKGISASVVYPGQGLWQGTNGFSFNNAPITSDMKFGIASNTKLFTAVTLLKLAENNIINIDDSLHEWLPTFPIFFINFLTCNMTPFR